MGTAERKELLARVLGFTMMGGIIAYTSQAQALHASKQAKAATPFTVYTYDHEFPAHKS